MKAWLKGGLIGGGILLFLMVLFWIGQSIHFNCILEPIQAVNVGGPECGFKHYLGISSLVYFVYPTIFGFLIGVVIGFIIGKIGSKK